MFVSVVGAIGAGKSTVIRSLVGTGVECVPVYEATAKWKDSGILEAFYANPEKHAFCFQLSVFNDYVDAVQDGLSQVTDNQRLIVERSIYCQPLFWKLQPKEEYWDVVYQELWKKWEQLIPEPSHFIFLDTKDDDGAVNELLRRIQERGRAGEDSVDLEYELSLVRAHKEFYTKERFGDKLLILDAMDPVESHVEKIKKFLKI